MTAADALGRLLGDKRIAAKAAEAGKQIREEDALRVACDAIESGTLNDFRKP
jgi:hypothetical protein